MSVTLAVQQLTVEIEGRPIFSDVSFDVTAGQTCQLVGPNGSGKTTLLMALCGLFEDFSGTITWCQGQEKLRLQEWPQHGLFMSPKLGLSPMLTPEENLSWFAGLMGLAIDAEQIRAALARMGFARRILRPVSTLSSGQQQRVKLSRLFLGKRPIWVLDEPFTALDLAAVAHLEQILAEHAQSGGLVLFTSHHRLTEFEPSVTVTLSSTNNTPLSNTASANLSRPTNEAPRGVK